MYRLIGRVPGWAGRRPGEKVSVGSPLGRSQERERRLTSIVVKRVVGIFAALALAVGISAGAAAPAYGATGSDVVTQYERGCN
jgi:hypothetical protein